MPELGVIAASVYSLKEYQRMAKLNCQIHSAVSILNKNAILSSTPSSLPQQNPQVQLLVRSTLTPDSVAGSVATCNVPEMA